MSERYSDFSSWLGNGRTTAEQDHMALKIALERTGALDRKTSEQKSASSVNPGDPRPSQIGAALNAEQRLRQLRTENYVQSLESSSSRSPPNQLISDLPSYESSPRPPTSVGAGSKNNKVRKSRGTVPIMSQLPGHTDDETSGEEYEPAKKSASKTRTRPGQAESLEGTSRYVDNQISKQDSRSQRLNSRKNTAKRAMNAIPSSFFGDFSHADEQTPVPLPLPPTATHSTPHSAKVPAPPTSPSADGPNLEESNLFVDDNDPVNDKVIVLSDGESDDNNDAHNTGDDYATNEQRKRSSQNLNPEPSSPVSSESSHKRSRYSRTSMYQMPSIAEEDSADIESNASQPGAQEGDVPRIYIVPITETPRISYRSVDDLDQKTLQENADWSDSDLERESDLGSVIDMIDDSDDAKDEAKKLLTPVPDKSYDPTNDGNDDDEAANSFSESSSDEEFVASPSDDIEELDPSETLSVAEARSMRGRRHRIPTLNYWLGERIEYAPEEKLGLLTAVDVRHVVPAVKKYRPRRRRHTRPRAASITEYQDYETAAVPPRPDVQIPVFDARDSQWHTETVAKSVVNDGFTPLINEKGNVVPKIYRSSLFGHESGSNSPLEVYMLKINAGGLFSRYLESQKSSVYLCWSGKCEIRLNDESFELPKGNAFYAPPANDLHIENVDDGSGFTTSVKLYVIEFNGPMSEELVNAMLRGATSMVADSSPHKKLRESPASEEAQRATHTTHETEPASEMAGSNILDLDEEPQPEEIDGPNFEYEEEIPDFGMSTEQPVLPENHAGSESALNSRASIDTFIKGFSRAVGNPELSQYSRDSRRNSRFVPPGNVASDDELDDFSAALQLGITNQRLSTQTLPSDIRNPIRRVQAITRSSISTSPVGLPSATNSRSVAERSIDDSEVPSYLTADDGENLLPEITRNFLLQRYRRAQQNAEEGEY